MRFCKQVYAVTMAKKERREGGGGGGIRIQGQLMPRMVQQKKKVDVLLSQFQDVAIMRMQKNIG